MNADNQPCRFWMVQGIGPATHRHDSLSSAQAEAKRLARIHRGERFFVMEAIECVEAIDVIVTSLRSKDECDDSDLIPF